jgi:hypothetical protein
MFCLTNFGPTRKITVEVLTKDKLRRSNTGRNLGSYMRTLGVTASIFVHVMMSSCLSLFSEVDVNFAPRILRLCQLPMPLCVESIIFCHDCWDESLPSQCFTKPKYNGTVELDNFTCGVIGKFGFPGTEILPNGSVKNRVSTSLLE